MFMRKIPLLCATAISLVAASQAQATALIQGTIFWGALTPTTPYSLAGSQSQFSFEVPNPLDANPTTSIFSFSYSLAGSPVLTPPVAIVFYPAINAGLFDIVFPDFAVSLYGADFLTGGFPSPGFYTLEAAIDGAAPVGVGGLALSFVSSPGVPEPASWALMVGGFGLLGGALRSAKRSTRVTYA
ncbi:PEPxxWA-CTERM sorting domain-containing protein [Sphingobium xanthum]|jgi:hypothetical protein|uniref:PEPxxWA-CTERM sorting domain-containing protein n=1 Tax=Sphingobium xanthum TaxID=1387165 RepID=UPI001C8B7908|nr:PEPxxWA-CTERM sorting domain-containing protein [Sphingobium xanthum]